jgi:hypothetical protein
LRRRRWMLGCGSDMQVMLVVMEGNGVVLNRLIRSWRYRQTEAWGRQEWVDVDKWR